MKTSILSLVFCLVLLSCANEPGDTYTPTETSSVLEPELIEPEINATPNDHNSVKSWRKIKSWNGTGMKNTESFTVTKPWRIVYKLKETEYWESNAFTILTYNTDNNQIESVGANITGVQKFSDTSYCYTAGNFRLDINPYLIKWNISVEVGE